MSRILLQLAVPAAVACTVAPVAYPLCDAGGAPACGNIGQTGRPSVAMAARPTCATGSLLAAGVNDGAAIARPLLDAHARPAPGNCAGKCGGDANKPSFAHSKIRTRLDGRVPAAAPAHLAGSRIAAINEGALVIDEDSGNLILVDARQRNVSYLPIGRGPGLLVYDPTSTMAYVADRVGNRIVAVRVGRELAAIAEWATPTEPYGVALAPDRKTLLVTAIADRVVVAYDVGTHGELWRAATSPEPRGVAIATGGMQAVVTSLTSGALDHVSLHARRTVQEDLPEVSIGRDATFPRGAFAATYIGDNVAVAFQRERPDTEGAPRSSGYGGSPGPIIPEVAFVGGQPRRVSMPVAQLPRALAWDAHGDRLYVAGQGSDLIQEIEHASQPVMASGRRLALTKADEQRCGPAGIAVSTQRALLVWCAFTRKVARLDLDQHPHEHLGPQLVASAQQPAQHAGMIAFHAADERTSGGGALACATCHPEGRSDGLSWRVDGQRWQTPVLAGRVAGTHPFKWDGSDATLAASLHTTTSALGGDGPDKDTVAQLAAYLEALPALAVPARDRAAVARGRAAFAARGCTDCHDGPALTDRKRHDFARVVEAGALRTPGGRPRSIDTPSLRGLAASAPYYHDGSAATLEAVLRGRGSVHMTDVRLSDAEVADVTAYLETL